MQAFQEPAVSMSIATESFANFQQQLSSFGLNPRDWRPLNTVPQELSRLVRARFILVHRDDDDLRLGVNVHVAKDARSTPTIADIEMILASSHGLEKMERDHFCSRDILSAPGSVASTLSRNV